MARALLSQCNLPLSIFGEAVLTAVYIINCCATKAIAEMAPEEAFTGHLTYMHLDLMHLFIFQILNRLSLSSRARNASFLGITAIPRHIKLNYCHFWSFLFFRVII